MQPWKKNCYKCFIIFPKKLQFSILIYEPQNLFGKTLELQLLMDVNRAPNSLQHVPKIGWICHQDLFTIAVTKKGWWDNVKEIFNDGSRAPTLQMTFKAMLLRSATCSILRSSAIMSGSLAKLLSNSFAILWASLK